jgi:hypothetical protein
MIFAIDIEANHSRTSTGEIFPANTSGDRAVKYECAPRRDCNSIAANQQSGGRLICLRSSRVDQMFRRPSRAADCGQRCVII